MEETNKENVAEQKMSYEELMQTAQALQQRLMMTEQKLMTIDFTAMRLEYLFKILDHASFFLPGFINEITQEIVDLLDVKKKQNTENKED